MNNNFNPYGGYNFNPQDYQNYVMQQKRIGDEKRDLRKRSSLIALGVWGFVIFSVILGLVLRKSEFLYNEYMNNIDFQLALESVLAIFMIVIPFSISYSGLNRIEPYAIPLSAPQNKKYAGMLIIIGLALSFVGSWTSGLIQTFFQSVFNITFTMDEYDIPTSAIGIFLYCFRSILIPCVVEELAMRGIVLQSLRKYGDKFAIIATAFVFAMLHGNLVQMPAAFIAGLGFGYAAIATGSIWTSVAIHFLNNLVSTVLSLYVDNASYGNIIYIAYIVFALAIVVVGIILAANYSKDRSRPEILKGSTVLSGGEKAKCFIFNFPMIVAIIYMAYVTSYYIE